MNTINLNKTPLKIAIVGPQKVGKTVIANSLSEFSHVVSPDYHPTMGCRILEMEKAFSDEQVKNIPILKNNKIMLSYCKQKGVRPCIKELRQRPFGTL